MAFLPMRQAMLVQRYAPYGILILLVLIILPGSPLFALLGVARPLADLLTGA
jgi:hypothetical protein